METVSSVSARSWRIRRKGHWCFYIRETTLCHLIITCLSKYTLLSTPTKVNAKVNPNVKYELWVIMRCQYRVISLTVANVLKMLMIEKHEFIYGSVVNPFTFYLFCCDTSTSILYNSYICIVMYTTQTFYIYWCKYKRQHQC